jgi:2'-5' RNA ligase
MRAFIAIELPKTVQDQVHQLQAQMQDFLRQRQSANPFRWTTAEQVHLTLRFLGEIDRTQATTLGQGLRQVAAHSAGLELALGNLGGFPNLRAPRILWIGLQGDLTTLGQLQNEVEQVTAASGLPADQRPFSPHLTIARTRRKINPRDLAHTGPMIEALTGQPGRPRLSFTVNEIVLMQSELLREGPTYTPIERFGFGAGETQAGGSIA